MENKTVEEKYNELHMTSSDGTFVDVQLESIMFSHHSWKPEQYRTVIIDIAERKQMEKDQEAFLNLFDDVLGSVREPLLVLDTSLKVVGANPSFYKHFCVTPENTEGALIYDLGNGQWDIPKLRQLLEEILPQNFVFNDFEVAHSFENIGPRIMHLNARKIYLKSNDAQLILLAIEDVTEREYYKRNLEDIVEARTSELALARQAAQKEKEIAQEALVEVKQLEKQLEGEKAYLTEEIKLEHNHENIIGKSNALEYVLYKVEQIAATDTTVLVLGETGTGKELIARAVHHGSPRKKRALVKINCAALPANLIENELFGHEKGAFTGSSARQMGRFEAANGATLFLDEIGELPLELQAKLLRVIQDGEFERLGSPHTIKVDVRIIAATNRNLEKEVKKGNFREDLWYRLNVFPITMPPLRERREDIPLLVAFYVKKIARRLGKDNPIVPKLMMDDLLHYHWPGNVRELENILERAVIISSGPKLRMVDDFNKPVASLTNTHKTVKAKTLDQVEAKTLEQVAHDYIVQVLEQTNWKVSGENSAAQILGLNRSTLRARMRKLDISKP